LLVISLAGIGDTLMATPLIRALRQAHPEAEIEALVLWPGSAQLLAGNPFLSTVHQQNLLSAPRLQSLRFLFRLRQRRYDASFNCHPQGRREYRLVTRLIGALRRLSHTYENESWVDRWLVTDTLPQDYAVPCAVNSLRLLGLLGWPLPGPPPAYDLFLTDAEDAWARQWLQTQGLQDQLWFGVHVGSGGTKNLALRRWPETRWRELFLLLQAERPDLPVVAFGGPGEAEVHARLATAVPAVRFPAFPSLRHAAALLRHARGFLSVDTAFMHLAAAVRVPHQFVLETPTFNPSVEPLRPDWIRIPNPAVGTRHLEFYRYDGRSIAGTPAELERIMSAVTVEAVLTALNRTC
jgi:ADP-heptose:LPS heptosyltransferase